MAAGFQPTGFQGTGFQGTISGGAVALAGGVTCASLVIGMLKIQLAFSSAVSAVGSATGNLFNRFSFAASVVAQGTVSAFLNLKLLFGSIVSAIGTVTANLTVVAAVGALRRMPVYLHGQIRHWRRHGH